MVIQYPRERKGGDEHSREVESRYRGHIERVVGFVDLPLRRGVDIEDAGELGAEVLSGVVDDSFVLQGRGQTEVRDLERL